MYTSVCKLSDLGLHQVISVGLHEDQTRNFHVKERENSFDGTVKNMLSLGNEIWSNGVVIQRKNPCNYNKTSPSATADSTNPTWISLALNLDPCDNGISKNLQHHQHSQQFI